MSDAPMPEPSDVVESSAPVADTAAPASPNAAGSVAEPGTAAPAPAPAVDQPDDELVVLDQLEADLAAVEQAITTLEQVASDGIGGEQAAAQIAAAVSADRFGGTPA
jgi:hypothetical protein